MNQSQFLAITCNSREAREKSRVHGATGFGFASHWLKNWRESFEPISKRRDRSRVITFDSHLKTALCLRSSRERYSLTNITCSPGFECRAQRGSLFLMSILTNDHELAKIVSSLLGLAKTAHYI